MPTANAIDTTTSNTNNIRRARARLSASKAVLEALSKKETITLGKRIAAFRRKAGVTKSFIARALKCSSGMLYVVENPGRSAQGISLKRQGEYAKAIETLCVRVREAQKGVSLPRVKRALLA
jgi:DNA-binding transcriptional regulator YiaG